MLLSIADPILQTQLFALCLIGILAFSLRRTVPGSLGIGMTAELKGFAIIAILLAHIGYFLAADTRFLFPLSVFAGVGVDLFLFLSGFGLAMSALGKNLSPRQFYSRRLRKIFIPLWIVLALTVLADLLIGKTYSLAYLFHAFIGWFPQADIYTDINSPLWYISLILFYYLVFPWIFSKRWPILSAAGLYGLTYALYLWDPVALREMMPVYSIHLMAFPLGIVAATFAKGRKSVDLIRNPYLANIVLGVLIAVISYFAIHSGVGEEHWIAEGMSILTVALILVAFLIKRFEVKFFALFGRYSFEIYLIHWPLLYRYDVFFKSLPAWLALLAYGALFLLVARLLQAAIRRVDGE